MPFILPFIPLIAAGVSAAGVADTVYNQVNAPSAPKTPAPSGSAPQSASTNQAQTAAVTNSLPTLQSLTGGSVSPEYAAQWGANQTGLNNSPQASGNIQQAINQFFGLTAPGSTGLTSTSPGGNSITDLLTRAAPGGGSGLVDGMLNSNEFKGLSG